MAAKLIVPPDLDNAVALVKPSPKGTVIEFVVDEVVYDDIGIETVRPSRLSELAVKPRSPAVTVDEPSVIQPVPQETVAPDLEPEVVLILK